MDSAAQSSAPCVVLLSGGLDSATVLGVARSQGRACHCLSINYGQRHFFEIDAARALAADMRRKLENGGQVVEHRVVTIDLRAIGGSALTDDVAVPKGGLDSAPEDRGTPGAIPVTYVPARNLLFLSIAAGYAETVGASDLFLGVNAVDYSGYPDCREPFLRSFEDTVNLGTKAGVEGRRFTLHAPLVMLTKPEIIRLGVRCGVRFELTHSCYDPDAEGRACGRCDSCRIRRRGFLDASVSDPTMYAPGALEGLEP